MKENIDEKFAQQLKSTLEQSVQDIDEDTRYQLQMARGKILNTETTTWSRNKTIWASTASVAVLSLFAVVFLVNSVWQSQETEMVAGVENIIFEEDINIEIFEEYEFYVWLSHQETNT